MRVCWVRDSSLVVVRWLGQVRLRLQAGANGGHKSAVGRCVGGRASIVLS